jgi:hypothetical protein
MMRPNESHGQLPDREIIPSEKDKVKGGKMNDQMITYKVRFMDGSVLLIEAEGITEHFDDGKATYLTFSRNDITIARIYCSNITGWWEDSRE